MSKENIEVRLQTDENCDIAGALVDLNGLMLVREKPVNELLPPDRNFSSLRRAVERCCDVDDSWSFWVENYAAVFFGNLGQIGVVDRPVISVKLPALSIEELKWTKLANPDIHLYRGNMPSGIILGSSNPKGDCHSQENKQSEVEVGA